MSQYFSRSTNINSKINLCDPHILENRLEYKAFIVTAHNIYSEIWRSEEILIDKIRRKESRS